VSDPTPIPTKTDDETAQPAQAKASQLPEWASLTAVVTGISIYAFATSSFYVWGLADVLKKPLAVYFSPTDYLRITPAWTVPTLSITGLAIIAYLSGMVAALSQRRSTTAKPSKGPILALALVLGTFTTSLFHSKWRGEQYARSGIPEAPLTQVLFESEKDKVASLEGKLIFDLDRYVLLYIEIDPLHPQISGRLVAIPHEKIKWIQIPPLSVEQKPIPAETSPRPPETIRRRVLASPVESPTPAETSPRPPATIQHNILASPVESPAAAETSPRPPEIIHRKILASPIESPLQLRLRLGRPGQHTTRFWRVRLSPPELQPSHRKNRNERRKSADVPPRPLLMLPVWAARSSGIHLPQPATGRYTSLRPGFLKLMLGSFTVTVAAPSSITVQNPE